MSAIPNASVPPFDESGWRTQWDALYEPHEWPDGAQISVCHQTPNGKFNATLMPMDYTRVTERIERLNDIANLWIGIAPMRAEATGRGSRADVIGVPALYADIDIAGPGHVEKGLPDEETAMQMIDDLPLTPTLVVNTGGGIHAYLAMDELLDPADETHADLMYRWEHCLRGIASRYGVAIDKGIAKDPTRILRVAGSINRKVGSVPTSILATSPAARYSIDDLDVLPAVERPLASVTHLRRELPEGTTDQRPGTVLAMTLPVSSLLAVALRWERQGDHMVVPRPDGSFSRTDTHAQLFEDDGVERITIFGTRGQQILGLDGPDHSLSSWDVLIRLCDGDTSRAAKLATKFGGDTALLVEAIRGEIVEEPIAPTVRDIDVIDPYESERDYEPDCEPESEPDYDEDLLGDSGVIGAAMAAFDSSPIAARFPELLDLDLTRMRPYGRSGKFSIQSPPQLWSEVVATNNGWTPVVISETKREILFARLGRYQGIWLAKVKTIKSGEDDGFVDVVEYEQISKFVCWRDSEIRTYHGDTEIGEPQFEVVVITAFGIKYRIVLKGKESLSIHIIQETIVAGLDVSTVATELGKIRTCLSGLGEFERRQDRRYTSTGWIQDDAGRWVMAAPAGSVAAAGIRKDIAVVAAEGAESKKLTGWDRVPTTPAEHRAGLKAIAAIMTICPKRPDWGVSHIGLLAAAPLALSQRTTLVVYCPPQSGKSIAMAVPYAAISSVPMKGASFPIYIPTASEAGTAASLAWHRHLPSFADDYRRNSDKSQEASNTVATKVFGAITQGSYTGTAKLRANQDGTERASARIETVGCVTAEVLAKETALVERCSVIQLNKGDVDHSAGGPIDQFRTNFHETGIIRMGYAGYLQFLASRLDDEWDGLSGMRDWADAEVMARYAKRGDNRASLATGYSETGWAALRAYAESVGAADVLPSEEVVESALQQMVVATARDHGAADAAPLITRAIRDMVDASLGHIANHEGKPPYSPAASGYVYSESPNGDAVWRPGGKMLGRWARDGQHVLLTPAGLLAAQVHAGLTGLDIRQIQGKIAPLCVEGSNPGNKVPSSYIGDRNARPRGYLLAVDKLDLDPDINPNAEAAEGVDVDF